VRTIWREAEEEAARMRSAALQRLDSLCRESPETGNADDEAAKVLREAGTRARTIRLASEVRLSERMYAMANTLLPVLRKTGYRGVFGRLAEELPPNGWTRARVHPGDVELARSFFRSMEIDTDDHISGGYEAETQDGAIRVTNTFEKRLERLWPRILPELMKEVYKECMQEGNAPEH